VAKRTRRILVLVDHQKKQRPAVARLRRLVLALLNDLAPAADFELGIHLLPGEMMAELNKKFLNHQGSTDVITFDYTSENRGEAAQFSTPRTKSGRSRRRAGGNARLHGEILISMDDALAQARQFRTSWQSELVRYIIHGLLHLQGYDDLSASDRVRMKRREDQLLQQVADHFSLDALAEPPIEIRPGASRTS